ncbi:MFS transporter [Streptomyces sp. ISL-14]|nr:MFS transporter [Streptomyces sp. ISL-14]
MRSRKQPKRPEEPYEPPGDVRRGAGGALARNRADVGDGPVPGGPTVRRRPVVVALMLVMALAAMDSTVIATCIPQIVSDLGGLAYFAWLIAGYLLAVTVMLPVYGRWADLYGRQRALIAGVSVFLLGSALCAVAWNMPSLIAFRVLQGLGGGAIQGLVQTIAGDLYDKQERGKIQAALSTVWVSAAVAGPALGGVFVTYASWRWIFLLNLPLGLFCLLQIRRHLHDQPQTGTSVRVDWLGAAGVFAATGLFLAALTRAGTAPWLSAGTVALLAGAAVCTVATVFVERGAQQPLIPGWVWRRRVMVAGNLAMAGLGLVATAPTLILPVYGQTVLGLSPLGAGFLLGVLMVSWPLSAAFVNRAYLRLGFRDTALLGTSGAALAAASFALLPERPPIWQPIVIMLVLGVSLGFFQPPLIVGVQSTVTWGERATATSSIVFWRQIGQSFGAALFGTIANESLRAGGPAYSSAPGRPAGLDSLSSALGHGHAVPPRLAVFLQQAVSDATSRIFATAAGAAALAFGVLLIVAPRVFPAVDETPPGA